MGVWLDIVVTADLAPLSVSAVQGIMIVVTTHIASTLQGRFDVTVIMDLLEMDPFVRTLTKANQKLTPAMPMPRAMTHKGLSHANVLRVLLEQDSNAQSKVGLLCK